MTRTRDEEIRERAPDENGKSRGRRALAEGDTSDTDCENKVDYVLQLLGTRAGHECSMRTRVVRQRLTLVDAEMEWRMMQEIEGAMAKEALRVMLDAWEDPQLQPGRRGGGRGTTSSKSLLLTWSLERGERGSFSGPAEGFGRRWM